MDMMAIRRSVVMNQTALVSKSGNPVSFRSALTSLPGCVVNIEPDQTGTGDPSPTNVRPISGYTQGRLYHTGKNLLELPETTTVNQLTFTRETDGTLSISGTASAATTYYLHRYTESFYGNVTVSMEGTITATGGGLYARKADLSGTGSSGRLFGQKLTDVSADSTEGVGNVWLYFSSGVTVSASHLKIMVSYTAQNATAFEPFRDDYLIFGKNLFNPSWFTDRTAAGIASEVQADGSIKMSGQASNGNRYAKSSSFMVLPAGTYTAKGSPNSVTVREGSTRVDTNGVFTSDGTTALNITVTFVSGNTYDITETIWIEEGSSAGNYEPYIGTIYGGTLNVLTGELIVDYGIGTIDENSSFTDRISKQNRVFFRKSDMIRSTNDEKCRCNMFKISETVQNAPEASISIGADNQYIYLNGITHIDSSITDMTALSTWLATHNITYTYPLATPLVYQLTAQQITALIGQNNIWTDTKGNIDIQYWGN